MLFGLGWVVGPGWVVPREVGSSARMVRSRPPPLTPADGHHRCFWLCHRSERAQCARRHQASTPVRRAACCAGGFVCVALVESVLRPSGWEKKCRLTCHCVRHISPDNKHGQPVKARHSLPSRWRAGTELCVPTNRKSRAARRARWGARTVQGAHAGFGSPSWFGQFPPGLTAQVSKLVEHS